jgi:hypothetical protein
MESKMGSAPSKGEMRLSHKINEMTQVTGESEEFK